MSLILEVPVSDIKKSPKSGLVLDYPTRCSRCGRTSAEEYDARKLRILARPRRTSFGRIRYQYTHPYLLKLRVCSECRQSDYVTHPEEVKTDPTRLGKIAHFQSLGLTVGGTIAALAILFNTPLIPAAGILSVLKQYWMYAAAIGVLLIFVMWFNQNITQKKTAAALIEKGYQVDAHPRAEVRTPALENEPDAAAIPLEIRIADDDWAKECAEHYGWQSHPDPE